LLAVALFAACAPSLTQVIPEVHSSAVQLLKPLPQVKLASYTELQPIQLGCAAYKPLIAKYGWNTQIAFAIMRAENVSCNPSIDNSGLNRDGSVDYGLFQINSIHADMVGGNLESLRDPATNIATAYKVYAARGWNAWSTYNNSKYQKYL